MKLIKGTCWAEALIDDARINDFTGKPFMPCAGKELTAEQIAAGIKTCTLRHGVKFGEKKNTCLNYMEIGAKKAEYAMIIKR